MILNVVGVIMTSVALVVDVLRVNDFDRID